jgi:hypothetical protein
MLKNIFSRVINTAAMIVPFGGSLRPFLHRMRGVKIGKNV